MYLFEMRCPPRRAGSRLKSILSDFERYRDFSPTTAKKGGLFGPRIPSPTFFCPASDSDLLRHCHRAARDREHRMAAATATTTATPISLRNREGIRARGWILIYVDSSE